LALLTLEGADKFTQEILYHTYHPTRKYYIKKLPWTGKGLYDLYESQEIWKAILDRSAFRLLSGQAQKNTFKTFIESLTPEDAELFKKIVKKDLRIGIGIKSINSVFPELIPEFGFMKAKAYDEKRLEKGSYVSLKIDCIRAMLRDRTLYSSGGNVITGVQHIAKQFKSGDEFDGELTIPGKIFQVASGMLRSNNDNPNAVFNIFDAPGIGAPFCERYEAMEQMSKYWPENIILLKHIVAKSPEHVRHQFAVALDHGYEGLVVKSPGHYYQLKRSWDWMKIKAADPEEVTIIGFNEGTGKFEGNLGSVKCRRKNGVIVDVGGFTDEIRWHIWNNKDLWLNEIIEILYHEETPDGSLRHPRFNYKKDAKVHRHRWDKSGRPLKTWSKSIRTS
jgi:DNA ligase-1